MFAAIYYGFAVFYALGAVWFLLVSVADGHALGILLAGGIALLGLRHARAAHGYLRSGLMLGGGRVVVRNPGGVTDVGVAEVDGFIAGRQPALGRNPTPGIVLVLRDGSQVPVWTLGSETWVWNTERNVARWQSTAKELTRVALAPRSPVKRPRFAQSRP